MYFACEKDMNFGRQKSRVLCAELCPSKIHMLWSEPPVPLNVTVCGKMVFTDIMKLKRSHEGCNPDMTGVLVKRGSLDTDMYRGKTI